MKPTPTPKTDRAVFEFDRGDRQAVERRCADFERRIHNAIERIDDGWPLTAKDATQIKRILTRSMSRKASTSQDKPKAANRRAKR
jgi:hypothetical protein